jgi:hypothetical protein
MLDVREAVKEELRRREDQHRTMSERRVFPKVWSSYSWSSMAESPSFAWPRVSVLMI